MAGSRLPCSTRGEANRVAAVSSGTRQSTPMTSLPASDIAPSSSPVVTPKWMRGISPATDSRISTEYGRTNSR